MNDSAIETVSRNFKKFVSEEGLINLTKPLLELMVLLFLCVLIYYFINIGNLYIEDNKRINIGKKQIFLFILIFMAILLVVFMFSIRGLIYSILAPFIFGIILAYILNPIVNYLQSRGIKRLWGVITVYLVMFIVLTIFSITLIPKLVSETRKLMLLMPKYSNDGYNYLYNLYLNYTRNIDNLPPEFKGIKRLLDINISKIENIVVSIIIKFSDKVFAIFSKVFTLILIPVLTFYFLKDADNFKRSIILLLPRFCRKEMVKIAKDIDLVLQGFIRGQLIVSALIALLMTLFLFVLKIEFAVLIGLIAGLSNVIPYIGPILGIIPGLLIALIDGPVKAIWVLVIFLTIQQLENTIITPKVVGKNVGIHPVFVILSLIMGGYCFGIFGLLLAIPLAAIIKILANYILNYIASI